MNERNNFLKKFLFGQIGHFGPKNGTSLNSGSAVRIFLKLCTMKRENDENDMNSVFQKKKFGANVPFWAQK